MLAVMTLVAITTKAGRPLNRSQIAIQLSMARTTVVRRLRALMDSGRVEAVASPHHSQETIYQANFSFYDEIVTPDAIQDWYNLAVSAAHDLAELRAALAVVYEQGSIPPTRREKR